MGMRNSMVLGILAIALIAAACSSSGAGNAADTVTLNDGESVKLSADDSGQYSPAVIKVERGSTVRIEGDTETLVGGMDTVVIEAYGVRKLIAPGDNVVEFKADKAGTFEMNCANGMGNAQLIVE